MRPKTLMTGTSIPTSPVRLVRRLRAARLTWKPRSSIAAWTRVRVSGATRGDPLRTRETVAFETPAVAARSMIVGARAADIAGRARVTDPSPGSTTDVARRVDMDARVARVGTFPRIG